MIDGIRAFDLRVALGPDGDFWIVHSLYGPRFKVVLQDIARFLAEQPNELLYVRIDHFHDYGLRTTAKYSGGTDRMRYGKHLELRSLISEVLGEHLIEDWTTLKTLESLRNPGNKRRIALFYNLSETKVVTDSGDPTSNPPRIPGFVDDNRYADNSDWVTPDQHKGDPVRFKTLTLQKIESAGLNAIKMHRLGAVTPTDQQFDAWWQDGDVGGNNPKSLRSYAADTNPHVAKWIRDEWATKRLNVIQMDFYPEYLVPLCLKLNGITVPNFTIPDDDDWGHYRTLVQIFNDANDDTVAWIDTAVTDVGTWFNTAYTDVNSFFSTMGTEIRDFFEQRFEAPLAGTPPAGGVAAGVRHYQVTLHRMKVLSAGGDPGDDLELYGQFYMVPSPFASTDVGANKTLWALSEDSAVRVAEGDILTINATKNLYVPESQAAGLEVALGGVLIENDDSIIGGGGDDTLEQDTQLRSGPLVFPLGNLAENEQFAQAVVEYVKDGEGRVAVYFSARRLPAPLIPQQPALSWKDNQLQLVTVDRLNAIGTGPLEASSPIPGRVEYQPAAGTFLPPGADLEIRARFIPTDTRRYTEKVVTRKVVVNPVHRVIPGRLEAEDFDGFHDLAAEPVTEPTIDTVGGRDVTGTQAGEWLAYYVTAAVPITYTPSLRFATASAGQRVELKVDGRSIPGGEMTLPNTGGAQRWETLSFPGVVLSANTHRLELHFLTGGVDVNYLDFNTPVLAEYRQNFDALADGATTMGDGSLLTSSDLGTATRVEGKALRMTQQTVPGTEAIFRLPMLNAEGYPVQAGFEASFRFQSDFRAPVVFQYGNLALRFLYEGSGSVLALVDGQLIPDGEGHGLFTADGEWHSVTIRWSRQSGTGRLTVTLNGQVRLAEIATPGFDPTTLDTMSLGANVGAPIRRNLFLDDIHLRKLPPETRILNATVGATDFSLLALSIFSTDYTLRNDGNAPLTLRSFARSDGQSPEVNPMILGSGEARSLKLFQRYEGDGDYRVTLMVNSDATAGVDADGNQSVEFVVRAPIQSSVAKLVARFPLDIDGNSEDGRWVAAETKDVVFGGVGARSWTGLAGHFNGTSSRVRHAWNALLNPGTAGAAGSFTLTAWVRTDGSGNYQSVVTSRRDADPDSTGYILYRNPNQTWEYWSGNGPIADNWQVLAVPAETVGQWQHLALVYDATFGRKTFYVDGEKIGTQEAIIGANRQQPFHIGSGGDLGDLFFFNGDIDDVAMFDGALTRSEVRRVMAGQYDAFIPAVERLLAREGGQDLGTLEAVDGRIVGRFTLINRGTAPVTVRKLIVPTGVSLDWDGGTLAPQASREIIMAREVSQAGPVSWQIGVNSDVTSGADPAGDMTFSFTAQATVNTGSTTVGAFTGGDVGEGLDLDGKFLYAFNVGSPGAAGQARDAVFTDDQAPGITLAASYDVPAWSTPELGESVADGVIEKVLQSIRWSAAAEILQPSVDVGLVGLVVGKVYKLQLLFSESCCADRAFDVKVAGQWIAREFNPAALQGGASPTPSKGVVITHEFTAASTTLDISLDGRGVVSPQFLDHNATLSGVTLESLGDASPPSNVAELLINGSFEEPRLNNVNENNLGTAPLGWNLTGPSDRWNLIRNNGSPYSEGVSSAADGAQILDLSGRFEVFQSFNLPNAATVEFGASFANRSSHDGSPPSKVGIYDATGNTLLSPLVVVDTFVDPKPSVAWRSGAASVSLPAGQYQIRIALHDGNNLDAVFARAPLPVASSNADLANLVPSAGALVPIFSSGTSSYTVRVPNATGSIAFTPTAMQANATLKVNGLAVASGATSSAMTLAVGDNLILIAVTAEDGTTVKSYQVTVTRAGESTPPDDGTPGLNRLFYSARPGLTLEEFYPAPRGIGLFPSGAEPVGAAPTQSGSVAEFEAPTDIGENYGQILHGYLVPTETADYTFYFCSDDQGELWLSTDDDPAHSRLIAAEPEWNAARTWNNSERRPLANGRHANVSASIRLEAGRYYYVEAVMKEAGGGDNLAVAWTHAGAPAPANGSAPVAGTFLRTKSPGSALPLRLTISLGDVGPIITWPNTPGYLLERADSLASDGRWSIVPFTIQGTQAIATADPGVVAAFFRLRQAE
ncbi:MAG: cadherin-like beta sandwich domain-containing protein [Verrucomicrobiales bacterium]|nr:cadherin-like beta sandwich domain-containing protein [Verrucomicrobiales bacterium]